MSMAPEAQFGCTFDEKENDDENDKLGQPNKGIRQFYFVKFNTNFVDPASRTTIEWAENLIQRLEEDKKYILSVVESIRGTLAPEEREFESYYGKYSWPVSKHTEYRMRDIKDIQRVLEKHWPQSLDEDPEEVEDPKLELIDIKEKTQKLTYQLAHMGNNFAEEKHILRELKYLQRRKEKLDADIKEAEAPKDCYRGSKHDIQRKICWYLEDIRDYPVRREAALRRYEAKKADINQQIAPLEEKLCVIEEKQYRARERILVAQSQIHEQTDCYDDYITILNKAKELAAKKDLVALEELSCKQVEKFMSRWRSDDAFRANYQRSITLSLACRNLNNDGTMLNPWEKPTTPGKRFRWQTNAPPS